MIKEKGVNYLLVILLIISVSFNLLAWGKIKNLNDSVEKSKEQNQNQGLELIENKSEIAYTTFSSPKADFEFEYPDTWVYEEKTDPYNPNSTGWSFYSSAEEKSGIPIFTVISPLTEVVNLCSDAYRDEINSYQVSTFPTNDLKTFVTYEQCGEEGYRSVYIYWQNGEYFRNASDIKDILKINLINFFSNSEEEMKIARHIAESIKIK